MAHDEQTQRRMRSLGIAAKDLEESFSRSGGPGGQHVNKVSTAVTLTHRPSGFAVTASDSRSQAQNRLLALERLLEEFASRKKEAHLARLAEASKNRARKNKRSLGLKKRMVESKRRRSETKKNRRRLDP